VICDLLWCSISRWFWRETWKAKQWQEKIVIALCIIFNVNIVLEMELMLFIRCITFYRSLSLFVISIVMRYPAGSGLTSPWCHDRCESACGVVAIPGPCSSEFVRICKKCNIALFNLEPYSTDCTAVFPDFLKIYFSTSRHMDWWSTMYVCMHAHVICGQIFIQPDGSTNLPNITCW
jgi:hypothetical protein